MMRVRSSSVFRFCGHTRYHRPAPFQKAPGHCTRSSSRHRQSGSDEPSRVKSGHVKWAMKSSHSSPSCRRYSRCRSGYRDTGRVDAGRLLVYEVGEDRQVMRRQVPDHIHIGLKQTEVDTRRIKMPRGTQSPGCRSVPSSCHRAGVEGRWTVHHQGQSRLAASSISSSASATGCRHGLFDQHMLTGQQRPFWPAGNG